MNCVYRLQIGQHYTTSKWELHGCSAVATIFFSHSSFLLFPPSACIGHQGRGNQGAGGHELVPPPSHILVLPEAKNFRTKRFRCFGTGKSLSEAILFAEHGENMWCTKIVLNIRNNFCTQHVLPMFCKKNSF